MPLGRYQVCERLLQDVDVFWFFFFFFQQMILSQAWVFMNSLLPSISSQILYIVLFTFTTVLTREVQVTSGAP